MCGVSYADAWYCILEGTAEISVAEARARATVDILASYATAASQDREILLAVDEFSMPAAPWRLQAVPYQRPVAHIKHIGDFGQDYFQRLARRNGFDEALLTGPDAIVRAPSPMSGSSTVRVSSGLPRRCCAESP
jgi:hypothetical protein